MVLKKVVTSAMAIGKAHGVVDVDHLVPHPTTVSRHLKTRAATLRMELMVKVRKAISDNR